MKVEEPVVVRLIGPVRRIVIGAMRNWSRNVVLWNLAADPRNNPHTDNGGCTMCQGAITIDGDLFTHNVAYYAIAHAAKFVRPGSVRIASNVPDTLPNVAFQTPDNKTVPLMTVEEYRKADLRAIESRARVQRDSINYFPPMATQACRVGFFAEPGSPAMAWDEVAVNNRRACVGRLFFEIPGGIVHGQYFLNVQFAKTLIRVPFRILTDDEEKLLSKNYGDIRKQVKEAFAPPKKK